MYTLKIRRVRNSLGVVLPKEALQKLRVRLVDKVAATETHSDLQTAHNPNFEKAMVAYRKVSNKYRNALRELAK
jgi:putative addiction module antidote